MFVCAEGLVNTSLLINRELEAFELAFLFLCTRQFQIRTPPVRSSLFVHVLSSLSILSSILLPFFRLVCI